MGAGDLEILDMLYVATDDDDPRLKVGDQHSGQGVGQDVMFFSGDGFIGLPNVPDASGGAGQAVVWTPGNDRFVIASFDGRYAEKAGTLAPGDRAIVSNCDAALLLSQADNSIQLIALAQQLAIGAYAQTQIVGMSTASGDAQVGPAGVRATWTPGAGVNARMELTSTSATMSFIGLLGVASIVCGADGSLNLTSVPAAGGSPSGVKVNGVPLLVP